MNSSSIFNCRIGALALIGAALTTSVWAGPSATMNGVSNSSSAVSAFTSVQTPAEGHAKREINLVYPYEMLIQGKPGWAEASFVIDYAGRPLFTTPAGASDPAFAKAAVAMIEANEFAPVKKNNRAVMTPSAQRFNFAGESVFDADARRVLAELRKPLPGICTLSELDERPKAVRQDSPVYPRALKDDGLTGQAEIEFVVSCEGKVLFPRIVSATQEDFGWAAAAAVAQWRFQSPTKNGQKVDVRMSVPILFDARKLAASD
jgi:TonB family protein